MAHAVWGCIVLKLNLFNMDKSKKDATIALKKAKTSIDNILKMIDEDKYCVEILQQILAIHGLLKSAANKILVNHLNTCFISGMNTNDSKEKIKLINELIEVLSLKKA